MKKLFQLCHTHFATSWSVQSRSRPPLMKIVSRCKRLELYLRAEMPILKPTKWVFARYLPLLLRNILGQAFAQKLLLQATSWKTFAEALHLQFLSTPRRPLHNFNSKLDLCVSKTGLLKCICPFPGSLFLHSILAPVLFQTVDRWAEDPSPCWIGISNGEEFVPCISVPTGACTL